MPGKSVARAAFQIRLKLLSQFEALKCCIELDLPWTVLGGVTTFAGVVIVQSLSEVRCVTAIKLGGVRSALENIGVEHTFCSNIACHP